MSANWLFVSQFYISFRLFTYINCDANVILYLVLFSLLALIFLIVLYSFAIILCSIIMSLTKFQNIEYKFTNLQHLNINYLDIRTSL